MVTPPKKVPNFQKTLKIGAKTENFLRWREYLTGRVVKKCLATAKGPIISSNSKGPKWPKKHVAKTKSVPNIVKRLPK